MTAAGNHDVAFLTSSDSLLTTELEFVYFCLLQIGISIFYECMF